MRHLRAVATVPVMRWIPAIVLVVVLSACSDEGSSANERACAEWDEHKDAGLSGDELLEDMERVADLASEADGLLPEAGAELREAASTGDVDEAFADMELACVDA